MIKAKSLWKTIGVLSFGTGMAQILLFVFGLLLVRKLDPIDYAVYKQGALIVATISPFFCILSPISLSYFYSKLTNINQIKAYLMQTIFGLMLISAIGSFLIFFFRNAIGMSFHNAKLIRYLPTFSIILFCESSNQFYSYYMVCINRTKLLSLTIILFSFLKTLALLISIQFDNNIFDMFIRLYLIANIIIFIYILSYTLSVNKGIAFNITKKSIMQQLSFSIPVFVMGMINALNTNLDKSMVALLYNPSMYSIYVNGAFQIPFVGILSSSIISIMLPNLAKRYDRLDQDALDGIILEFKEIIKVSYAIMFSVFISILTFSEGVVIILFSRVYLSSLPIFKIYLLMILLQSFNLGILLTAANEQKKIVRAGILMILSNIFIMLIIKHLNQFNLLALAPVLSFLIMHLLLLSSIRKVYHQNSIKCIIPINFIFRSVFPGILFYCIFKLIDHGLNMSIVMKTIILGPLCFCCILLLISYIIRHDNKQRQIQIG